MKGYVVKAVVIGGTGPIGSKLDAELREHGHEAAPAAPNTGVNPAQPDRIGPGR